MVNYEETHTLNKNPREMDILRSQSSGEKEILVEKELYALDKTDPTKRQTTKYYTNICHMNTMIEKSQILEAIPGIHMKSKFHVIILKFYYFKV